MNETLKVIRNRYSCRNFTGEALEQDKIDAIALAGIQSPSAMNMQPWELVVIQNKALLDELDVTVMEMLFRKEDKTIYNRIVGRGGKIFYNAPCMYVIAKKAGTDLDCGIVSENIALAASSLGLGNVICGLAGLVFATENGKMYKEKLIPEGYEFGVAVLVGYAANDQGTPHEMDLKKIQYIK